MILFKSNPVKLFTVEEIWNGQDLPVVERKKIRIFLYGSENEN